MKLISARKHRLIMTVIETSGSYYYRWLMAKKKARKEHFKGPVLLDVSEQIAKLRQFSEEELVEICEFASEERMHALYGSLMRKPMPPAVLKQERRLEIHLPRRLKTVKAAVHKVLKRKPKRQKLSTVAYAQTVISYAKYLDHQASTVHGMEG